MMWNYYTMRGDFGMFGGLLFGLFIFKIIVLAIFVYIIYRIVKKKGVISNTNVISNIKSNKSLDILDERLAKGEITEEEYKRIKNILKNDEK
jgi:putative membrane protein